MKTPFLILLLLTSFLSAEMRTWVNSKGQKLVAELKSATDDSVTLILKRNRKSYVLKREDLSEADQEFITTWIKENAEKLEKQKEAMFTFGDTKLTPGRAQQLTLKIDKSLLPKDAKVTSPTCSIGIAVPNDFDPVNKVYTVVQITVAGKGQPSKSLGAYMKLVQDADCILIAADNVAYGNTTPSYYLYKLMDKKWQAKEKKWPMAFYGFSGGAKAAAYSMAQAAKDGRNIIGAYMSGCNGDRTADAMEAYKLKTKNKKRYKLAAIWLSSGDTDNVATPAHHKSVLKSMKSNRMKYIKINTFKGAHTIYRDDQVEALNWMKAQER